MRTRAFTLLEVLISLAIFGLAAVVLASSYINVLNAYDIFSRANVHDENVRFARSLLLAEPDRQKAEQGDDFDASDSVHVRWHSTIEQTGTADLFHVTFVCEITDSRARSSAPPITETFMLLRPTWSEGLDITKLRQDAKDRIVALRKKTP